ncbi:hybrid sensor histidine kinase/response regulator [Maribacter halichondriae]|uniref:hybrid sensor histidine kinase/response regulator n=1 Tax=Maribacter halichondriae TaxID=2980554 RepID=UPI0023595B6A|nr:ATP-binding protein [Maribacter sp. Hal144]
MNDKSKNRFTVKIMLSYLVLCALALVSGYFIYTEIQVFMSNDTAEETDVKLLKTGALVTELYKAESLSKLALNSNADNNFLSYAQKIDSIRTSIDSLKMLSQGEHQRGLLDSLQILLGQKVENNSELRKLKKRKITDNSLDKALKEFDKIKESFGKFSAESMYADFDKLSPSAQKILTEYANILSENAPKNPDGTADAEYVDSILTASRVMLERAKLKDFRSQQSLAQKELEVNRNDLELSRQLQNIIAAFEQEIMFNTYEDNQNRQLAMRRTMRLAGITALLGFIIVAIFTLLINRDFWKVQVYRQKLEKEKKYSESLLKSREQLISTVSHDLRTPLNTITGYTELMENTSITDKQSRYLKNVKSASEYVGNLVNDLLDFSKLEAGKLNIEKVPFIAANLIQETAENVEALYRNKNLKLQLEIDPELEKTVAGDPFRIRQILTNLLGNAFKFTEEGSIIVKAETIGGSFSKKFILKLSVIDTGIGIPQEKQDLIFKEFTQADRSTEKKFGGYGLGLTISKKLAELLNGSLHLESKEDHGSTFTLQIPLEITNKAIAAKEKTEYLVPKLKMLIIDDDTALLGMLSELAESMGITAHTFSNFLAIKEDSHLAYDIVLTDIQMPQVTGFEVLKILKSGKYDHYTNQPIIAMTGRRDLDTEAYTALGFAQVLQKPFSKGELIGMLNMLGIKTKKAPKKVVVKKDKETASHIYSLEIIYSFLGDNEDAVYEVLQTFLSDTNTNLDLLSEAVNTADYAQINKVAHRMLPMFRQLKVNSTVPILEKLEIANWKIMNRGQLLDAFQKVKLGVSELVSALNERLATSPSYNG